MAAIKKLVFEDKKYTLEQLNEALLADFVGYEQVRRDCLDAPKYGNDDEYADNICADIIQYTEQMHRGYKTMYSHMSHGTLSISNNTPLGMMTGASANGRKAWMPPRTVSARPRVQTTRDRRLSFGRYPRCPTIT